MRNLALLSEIQGYRRRTPAYQELVRLMSHAIQLEWLLRCKPGKATKEEWDSLWMYLRDEVYKSAHRLSDLVVPGGSTLLSYPSTLGGDPTEKRVAEFVSGLKSAVNQIPLHGLQDAEAAVAPTG